MFTFRLSSLTLSVGLAIGIGFTPTAIAYTISQGGSLNNITVLGTTSIYDVFGHAGNPGGDYGPDSPAVLTTFGAGSGNVFTFSATGLVSCCGQSQTPYIPPDGYSGSTNITGANGLSNISGNAYIPMVGVFTTNTDPYGSSPPSALTFDANAPKSLSPILNQVFYIGDGLSGYNNPSGSQLTFTAPTNATRLYLGVIDAYGFNGTTGYYNDNAGSFNVNMNLAPVPEPETYGMMLAGLGLLSFMVSHKKSV